MNWKHFTHDQLIISPLNVRTNEEDANATEALEASIAARGLLFPLIVHEHPDFGGKLGVVAGGRRWRAIGKLIAAGRVPADMPIQAILREFDEAELTEISLMENLPRRDLRPYEIQAAVAHAFDAGSTIEDISTRCGQRVEWVRQNLRLGKLAPLIFQAYADGQISLDQACAYAGTEDPQLQLAAWGHFSARQDWERTPRLIRAWLKIGDEELTGLLRFVGHHEYVAAGGAYEQDLFDDGPEQRGRVTDEDLLRKLAEEKLAAYRARIRQQTGLADLRFAQLPPQHQGSPDYSLEVKPETIGTGDLRRIRLPEGDVIGVIRPQSDGTANISFWWASRKARREATRRPESSTVPLSLPTPAAAIEGSDYAQRARASVKDEHGLTADGLQAVRSMRRELLRALLVDDADTLGTIGRDYIIWSQLRQALTQARNSDCGTRALASDYQTGHELVPVEIVAPHLENMPAHAIWLQAMNRVRSMPAFSLDDHSAALEAFTLASEGDKRLAGAVLAGLSLLRSANADGFRIPTHDRAAQLAHVDDASLREYWQPSTTFLGLFPKLKRLELAQPYVPADAFRNWHKLPDRDLTAAVASTLQGETYSDDAQRTAASSWVHPLLSFGLSAGASQSAASSNMERE